MTQQAVTGLVPERLRLAGDHSHRGRSGARAAARSCSGRAGPVPVAIGPSPVPRQPAKPDGTPAGPATPARSPALVLKPARTSITC